MSANSEAQNALWGWGSKQVTRVAVPQITLSEAPDKESSAAAKKGAGAAPSRAALGKRDGNAGRGQTRRLGAAGPRKAPAAQAPGGGGGAASLEKECGFRVRNAKVGRLAWPTLVEGFSRLALAEAERRLGENERRNRNYICAVVSKSSGAKTSNADKPFVRLSLSDLDGGGLTLLAFGEGVSSAKVLGSGDVVLIKSPCLLPSRGGASEASVSVSSGPQVFLLGRSVDMATCEGVTRAGHRCSNAVDGRRTRFCGFHVAQARRAAAQKRAAADRRKASAADPRKASAPAGAQRAARPAPSFLGGALPGGALALRAGSRQRVDLLVSKGDRAAPRARSALNVDALRERRGAVAGAAHRASRMGGASAGNLAFQRLDGARDLQRKAASASKGPFAIAASQTKRRDAQAAFASKFMAAPGAKAPPPRPPSAAPAAPRDAFGAALKRGSGARRSLKDGLETREEKRRRRAHEDAHGGLAPELVALRGGGAAADGGRAREVFEERAALKQSQGLAGGAASLGALREAQLRQREVAEMLRIKMRDKLLEENARRGAASGGGEVVSQAHFRERINGAASEGEEEEEEEGGRGGGAAAPEGGGALGMSAEEIREAAERGSRYAEAEHGRARGETQKLLDALRAKEDGVEEAERLAAKQHAMEVDAWHCRTCRRTLEQRNPVCNARGHFQKRVKATKRFFACGHCGHRADFLGSALKASFRCCPRCNRMELRPCGVNGAGAPAPGEGRRDRSNLPVLAEGFRAAQRW